MAYRTFFDDQGVRWEVWAVRLQAAERRSGRDRRDRPMRDGVDPDLAGRRRGDRRQLHDHDRPRLKIAERFAAGWLAFESPTERRRLAPIPVGWDGATESELRVMCARAGAPRGRGE
jgi:hypothetical protein